MTSSRFQVLTVRRAQFCAVIFGLLLTTFVPAYGAELIGRVLSTTGRVVAVRQGQSVVLQKDARILVGDEIVTDAESYAQIHFSDSSIMSLKPRTVLQVNDYAFAGTEDGSEKAIFSLLRGGMRTVTGLIGHLHHDSYGVITPTATIGIRGTVWAATQCDADECKNSDGTSAKPGTYGEVNYGVIAVKNDTPEVEFGSGAAFYVADRQTSPLRLLAAPDFVTQAVRKKLSSTDASGTSSDREELNAESSSGGALASASNSASDAASAGLAGPSSSGESQIPASTITESYVASNNTTPSGTSTILGAISFNGFYAAYSFYYNSSATAAANANGTPTGVGGYVYYPGATPKPYVSDGTSSGLVESCPNPSGCTGPNTVGGNVTPDFRGLQLIGWTGIGSYQSTLSRTAPIVPNGPVIDLGVAGPAIVEQLKGPYAGNDTGIPFNGSPGSLIYLASSTALADVTLGAPVFASGSYAFGGAGAFIGIVADSIGDSGRVTALTGTLNATTEAVSFSAIASFPNFLASGPATFTMHSSGYLPNFNTQLGGTYTGLASSNVSPNPQSSFLSFDTASIDTNCAGEGCRLAPSGPGSWSVSFIGTGKTGLAAMVIEGFLGSASGQPGPSFNFLGVAKCKAGKC